MSEQTSLVAVEIESGPTLFPQFSPTRFVGIKGVDPGNEFDLNQGVGGGGGGGYSPIKQKTKEETKSSHVFRIRIISRADGLLVGFLKARFRFLLVGRHTRSRLMASLICPVQGIGQLLLTVHRLQKVRTLVYSSTHE